MRIVPAADDTVRIELTPYEAKELRDDHARGTTSATSHAFADLISHLFGETASSSRTA